MSDHATSTAGPSTSPGGQPARPSLPPLVGPRQVPETARTVAGRRSRKPMRVLMIAALLLLPPAVAVALSASQPPTYASEVDLLYQPDPSSSVDSIDRDLATHGVLLQRRDLVEEAARAVGREPAELDDDMSVEAVEGSAVLRLRVTDQDAGRARETAQFIADRYLRSEPELAGSMGTMRALAPAAVLDDPVAPEPLRAAAAGGLLGLVLVALFVLLLPSRRDRSERSDS